MMREIIIDIDGYVHAINLSRPKFAHYYLFDRCNLPGIFTVSFRMDE